MELSEATKILSELFILKSAKMAYLKLGFTRPELAEQYTRDVQQGLPPTELVGRYGKRPGRFLDPTTFPGYSELSTPEFGDQGEREYTRVDVSDKRRLYVRLPVSVTRKEHTSGRLFGTRQDFPKPGDKLRMRKRGKKHRDEEEDEYTVMGLMRAPGHVATALVEVDRDLPDRDDTETDERFQRRLEQKVETMKRKFHIHEGETQLSQETQKIIAGNPRVPMGARKHHRHGIAAPRAQKVPTVRMLASRAKLARK